MYSTYFYVIIVIGHVCKHFYRLITLMIMMELSLSGNITYNVYLVRSSQLLRVPEIRMPMSI